MTGVQTCALPISIDMTIEIYNLQVLGRVLGKLNQVPDVIDARRLHGG